VDDHCCYDFENRRTRFEEKPFFPDVDSRFKFCAFVASPTPVKSAFKYDVVARVVSVSGPEFDEKAAPL